MNCTKINIFLVTVILWAVPFTVAAQNFTRTTVQVERLSCTSCLSRIEAELKKVPGMIGMAGDLRTGQVVADHNQAVTGELLAVVISDLGYPAKVIREDIVFDHEALFFDNGTLSRCGAGGCNSTACSATASAWKELYHRIFKKSQP